MRWFVVDIKQLGQLWIDALAASPPSLEQYENLAEELVKSWKSGDPEVIQAVKRYYGGAE
jgi:hypothetical protein